MKLRSLVLSLVFTAPAIGLGGESAWRSVFYSSDWRPPTAALRFGEQGFLQDFSGAGYRYGNESIPNVSKPVIDVTSAAYGADPGGTQDSTAAIQRALDDAGTQGGGVVYLPTGTYLVQPLANSKQSLLIGHSDVVLRGDGAGRTFLLNTSGQMRERAIIRVTAGGAKNWRMGWQKSTLLTRDELGPTTQLRVERTAGFQVGDWICLRNDITDDWIAEQPVPAWLGLGSKLGGLTYLRRITKVDAALGEITIDLPTRFALKVRDRARIGLLAPPLSEVGLEDFSIANRENPAPDGWSGDDFKKPGSAGHAAHQSTAITLDGVVNSWISRVASYKPAQNQSGAHLLSNGIELDNCRSVTLRQCDFQRPQYGGEGGNGYMYRLSDSGDNLLTQCRAEFSRHGFVFSGLACSGNVLFRCRDEKTGRATGASGEMLTSGYGSDHHMHFSHSNLVDNCTATESLFLAVYRPFGNAPQHGLTAAQSVFWNTTGDGNAQWRVGESGRPLGRIAVASEQWGAGYVIGTQGPRSEVKTGPFYQKDALPDRPVDHVEGQGRGATLEPASLYLDQLARSGKPRPSP